MAKLTGQTIANSYDQLLIVGDADGITSTAQAVESADTGGNTSLLYLSTTEVYSPGLAADSSHNTVFGKAAGAALADGGIQNVMFGASAGESLTTGDKNIIIGFGALDVATTALENVAIGDSAMSTVSAGEAIRGCVAIGYNAFLGHADTDTDADNTIAIGKNSLKALRTGQANIAIGYTTMVEETIGDNNTVFGYGAMSDSGNAGDSDAGMQNDNNTFLGHLSGSGDWTSNASSNNTAVGKGTMVGAMNNSNNNTAIGYNSLPAVTTGDSNVGIGKDAGSIITTGGYNTFLGFQAQGELASESNATKIGANGIIKYFTSRVNCDLGGATEDDPAHATPIGKIPRYAVITRVTAVVQRLSSDANHTLKLVLSSDSSGADDDVLSDVQELIGAGASNSWSATGAAGAAADIKVDDGTNGAILKTAYVAIPYDPAGDTDSGLATLDTEAAATYVYLAFADSSHSNGDADPSTSPKVDVMIEYAGLE